MNLTEKPEVVTWPETHYIFVEKIGPFMQTARPAWEELYKALPKIKENNKVTGKFAMYKIDPDRMVYRAGVSVAEKPGRLPEGFLYKNFHGGKYSKFTLTGSYANLPKASGRVFELVKEFNIQQSGGFNIENYVNEMGATPEEQLITEILIATR